MMRFVGGCFFGVVVGSSLAAALGAFAQAGGGAAPGGAAARDVPVPFRVLGASGAPLLVVDEANGAARLVLAGRDGRAVTLGTEEDGSLGLTLAAGAGRTVRVRAGEGGVAVEARSGDDGFALVLDGADRHLAFSSGGHDVVDLGTRAGTNAALRIARPDGGVVAQVGSSAASAGAGAVLLGDGTGPNAVSLAARPGNLGTVSVYKGDKLAADMDGDRRMVSVWNSAGSSVARLQPSKTGDGGKVAASDAEGTDVFIGGLSGKGGGVCTFDGGRARCMVGP